MLRSIPMSVLTKGGRLLPGVAVACAAAACALSGLGADRLLIVPFVSGCYAVATYYVTIDQPSFALLGIAVALLLIVASLLVARFARSDSRRLHLGYVIALVGFVVASVMWAVSAAVVFDSCTAPRAPVTGVPGGHARLRVKLSFPDRFRRAAILEPLLTRLVTEGVSRGEGIWILYDHDGRVVCVGEEQFDDVDMGDTLQARYPGIKTSASGVTMLGAPVAGEAAGGHNASPARNPVQLRNVWLAEDSPIPGCAPDSEPRTEPVPPPADAVHPGPK